MNNENELNSDVLVASNNDNHGFIALPPNNQMVLESLLNFLID